MGEDKIMQIKEEPMKVETEIKSTTTEVDEASQNVEVQVPTPPSFSVEDANIIDIGMDEAFPYMPRNNVEDLIGSNNILIDGQEVNGSNTNGNVSLVQILTEYANNSSGEGTTNHSLLDGRELPNQHPISAISGLRDELDDIEAVKRTYASESGLSEFRKWNDGNPSMENRAGYFVKLVTGTENIDICTDKDDVYGVTVINSGFVGNQIQSDKSDDPSYSMVGIAGALRVRTDGTARNGEYVVPDATGIATFSENGCGYKVISQGSYSTYPYVTIAVTPQNDKLSKIYGMLTEADGTLGNLGIRIEDIEDKVNEASQKADIIITDNESIKEIINENKQNIEQISNISNSAYEAAQEAKESVSSAVTSANEAMKKAQEAALEAQNAADDLANAMDIVNDMEPLVSFESGDYKGAAGIVAIATENQMNLGQLMQTVTEQGSDLAAAILKSDENGVTIQNLVSHIDKYSAGQYSTSYGLSKDNAKSILVDKYIYVPTVDHTETMYIDDDTTETISFVRGYSYEWDSENGTWIQRQEVSFTTTYKDGTQEGDLWLCWQDVEVTDENGELAVTYISGTLYRWFGSEWIAVASVADNAQSRMLTTSTQTADEISQSILNSTGEGSTVKQKLDSIISTVYNNEGYISAIEQTAESIRAGAYTESGNASQLELLVSDTDSSLNAVTAGRFHIMYQSYLGAAPDVYEDGNKYSKMPTWDEELGIFVFNDAFIDNTGGIYYFYSDDHTKYCKVVDGGYEIYTIGNKATSLLSSRIDNTEAILSGSVEYATENSEAFAGIVQKANENSAKIDYVTSYYYHTLLSISETEIPVYGDYKYSSPPTWNPVQGRYEFNIANRDENGIYYLVDDEATTYCKIATTGDGQPLYEIYGLAGSYMSSISQGADENGGYIQSMVLDIERYSVGQYSQSYGMSYDDAVKSIPVGAMYVPTVAHSENLIRDEITDTAAYTDTLNAGTLEEREYGNDVVRLTSPPMEALDVTEMQTYDFEVSETGTYRYEWDGTGWTKGPAVSNSSEYFEYDGTENTTNLWYCTKDVYNPAEAAVSGHNGYYKAGTLYAWKGNRWVAIATTHDNLLSRSLSLVRQTANSYSIELHGMQGDFSQYKQTVDSIGMLVHGADGAEGSWTITSDGLYGQVFSRTNNSGTLRMEVDAIKAAMELMITGYYPMLEQALSDNIPEPYEGCSKYSVRPEWSASLNKFVFDDSNIADDGIYYFFDNNEKHYCKVVGTQYEVYKLGNMSTAGTDAIITEEYAALKTLATNGNDQLGTFSGLRNLALAGKAEMSLLTSLDTNILERVVDVYGYTVPDGTSTYSDKPTYIDGAFSFTGQVEDANGEYFLINSQQFGKLIIGSTGSCYGYEVYSYGGNSTAGLVGTVLDNQAKIGMMVDVNGVKGGVVVEAINDQSEVKIYGDKLDIKGITTVSNSSGSSTVIDGSYITTGNIKSNNYSYSSGYFSTSGTQFNLTNGAITSENFAIDSNGNLYLKGDISATNARIKGGLNVGSSDGTTYNFTVDANGNVSVAGTLNATVLKFNGKSVLTTDDKISADYLELKGITIRDNSGNVTFKVDSNGYVTISGTMTGSISWGDITGVPSTVTGAYNLADSAYDKAANAQADASNALDAADSANSIINNWSYKYEGTTYIDGAQLMTGTVTASTLQGGSVELLDGDANTCGALTLTSAQTADYAVDLTSNGALRFKANDGSLYLETATTFIQLHDSPAQITVRGDFMPAKDNYMDLGDSEHRWHTVYAATDKIITSDRDEKQDIEYDVDRYESFFMSLKPTQYKFIDNHSNRYHIGFISQDVEESLVNNKLSSLDFAGFVKSPIYEDKNDKNSEVVGYRYGLRYSEFIALNTHMIQKLYTKIDELENKIQELEKSTTETE